MLIEDLVKQALCGGGIQNATGVQVTYPNGTVLTIHSDNHPALSQEVSDVPSEQPTVKAVNSAQGGN